MKTFRLAAAAGLLLALVLSLSTVLAADDEKVFVTGSVNHPGSYSYVEGMVFRDLVDRAGGLSPQAGTNPGLHVVRIVNGTAVRSDATWGTQLDAGDTVAVVPTQR